MILVTGGASFIGSNFVIDLLSQVEEHVINLNALTIGTIESLQGFKVACLEEFAFHQGSASDVSRIAEQMSKTSYGQYLKILIGDFDA